MPELTPDAGAAYVAQERAAGRDPFRAGQRNAKGRQICGGKGKRRQAPCLQTIICRNGRCRMHNGQALSGVAHPGYKHGRYAENLPSRLLERYQASVADPELLNLSAEIALLDSRVADVLSRVDSGESGALWRSLGRLRARFLAAQRAQDQDGMQEALVELLNAVGRGHADFEAWAEVADLLERRRRLVESEQKRRVAMQQVVTAEQALGLIAALGVSMRGAVLDRCDPDVARDILAAVQRDLDRFAGVGAGAPPDGQR